MFPFTAHHNIRPSRQTDGFDEFHRTLCLGDTVSSSFSVDSSTCSRSKTTVTSITIWVAGVRRVEGWVKCREFTGANTQMSCWVFRFTSNRLQAHFMRCVVSFLVFFLVSTESSEGLCVVGSTAIFARLAPYAFNSQAIFQFRYENRKAWLLIVLKPFDSAESCNKLAV